MAYGAWLFRRPCILAPPDPTLWPSCSRFIVLSALQGSGYPVKMLNMQYRMHPAISTFPSRQFYGGGLLDGSVSVNRAMHACTFSWS